jgi:hypothetical protein
LARCNPVGDEEDDRRSHTFPTFTGDSDLALHTTTLSAETKVLPAKGERSHERDSGVGYPIFLQKSAATSTIGVSGLQTTGGTNGTSSKPHHATSSAIARHSSSSESASTRQENRDPGIGDREEREGRIADVDLAGGNPFPPSARGAVSGGSDGEGGFSAIPIVEQGMVKSEAHPL